MVGRLLRKATITLEDRDLTIAVCYPFGWHTFLLTQQPNGGYVSIIQPIVDIAVKKYGTVACPIPYSLHYILLE